MKTNVIVTASKLTDISFATMNQIKALLKGRNYNLYTTYETYHNFAEAVNVPKFWLTEKIKQGVFHTLIVVGHDRPMSIIDAAEENELEVILFKEI